MSNIKPELANNALGSLTASAIVAEAETEPIDALWSKIHLAPGGKNVTKVNVPTFAEALRTAMATSVEVTGPGEMIMGLRNDVWQ